MRSPSRAPCRIYDVPGTTVLQTVLQYWADPYVLQNHSSRVKHTSSCRIMQVSWYINSTLCNCKMSHCTRNVESARASVLNVQHHPLHWTGMANPPAPKWMHTLQTHTHTHTYTETYMSSSAACVCVQYQLLPTYDFVLQLQQVPPHD